jgi:hypothetical protein
MELGALVDEKIDPRDISAEIVNLAIKKYITIIEHPGKWKGFLEKESFEFKRGPTFAKDPTLANLTKHEQAIFRALTLDTAESAKLKDIKGSFIKGLKSLKDDLYEDMVKDGYFPSNPAKVRNRFMILGFVSAMMFNILTTIICFAFASVMTKRTKYGAEMKRYGMGMREFLEGQKRQLEFQEEHYYLFEKLLPYAIVFGSAKVWAKRFAHMTHYTPEWYESTAGNDFIPLVFVNRLHNNLSTIQSSYTATKSSSGFSGGSVGGGFGGGGGGSW